MFVIWLCLKKNLYKAEALYLKETLCKIIQQLWEKTEDKAAL